MGNAPLRTGLVRKGPRVAPIWGLVLLLMAGCQSATRDAASDPQAARLLALSMLYARYQNANQGRSPASEEQFKTFIREYGNKIQELVQTDDADAVFTSLRDGQPYVVLYGKATAQQQSSGLVAYETEGADGKRYVGYRLGYVEEVDEERFRQLIPDVGS